MLEEYKEALRNYANFNDRATRKQYWSFTAMNYIIQFAVGFLSGFLSIPIVSLLYFVVMIAPVCAITVRRYHDTNHAWYFMFVPVYNLILLFMKGTGNNKWGEGEATSPFVPEKKTVITTYVQDEDDDVPTHRAATHYIKAETGALAGRTYLLEQFKPKLIGKNRDLCQIIIPDARVSNRHCTIEARGDAVIVKDVGSMNGTFAGGRRMALNEAVMLKEGDVFYVAVRDNRFRVMKAE